MIGRIRSWAVWVFLCALLITQALVLSRVVHRLDALDSRLMAVAQQETSFVENRQVDGASGGTSDAEMDRVDISPNGGPVRGAENSEVTIIEFADYQCPYCAAAEETLRQVMDQYEGKVRIVHRDFPLSDIHALAVPAAEAARCAGEQDAFWEYHDLLYARLRNGLRLANKDQLIEFGQELDLDVPDLRSCLESERYRESVQKDWEEGVRYGVSGTPTFFINGYRLVGARSASEFAYLIDRVLADTTHSGYSGAAP